MGGGRGGSGAKRREGRKAAKAGVVGGLVKSGAAEGLKFNWWREGCRPTKGHKRGSEEYPKNLRRGKRGLWGGTTVSSLWDRNSQ